MSVYAQCIGDTTMSYGLGGSLFLAGLVGGFTHCVAMCSPFVLAQSGTGRGRNFGSCLLLPYHLGRITTYIILAVLVSSIINLVFVFSDLKSFIAAPLLVVAGVIFLSSAFPRLSALFPWASGLRIGAGYGFVFPLIERLAASTSIWKRYMLGMLLGFMPCGLVISALMASAAAPNVMVSAVVMLLFAIGTMPSLVLVALGGQTLKNRYPKYAGFMSRGAMLVSGVWLFVLAGIMVL